MDWNWPGSRWWKVDLHSHSPASHDFGNATDRAEQNWLRWVESAKDSGLHAIAVTDHNTSSGVGPLSAARQQMADAPTIFPGVEITASDGTHLLAVFAPGATSQHVDELLTLAHVSVDSRGTDTARSTLNLEQLLGLNIQGCIFIGAHINGPAGLLELQGQERLQVLAHPKLSGVEVSPDFGIDESLIDGSNPAFPRKHSRVWCSDGHSFEDLGRRFTWIKMSQPDIEGLRLALFDGAESLIPAVRGGIGDPNRHSDCAIEEICVTSGKFMGRVSPLRVRFNPWLSTLIGGRGTGKSSLVDFARSALGRRTELELGQSGLPASYEKRMRVPPAKGEEGLLTPDTAVEVIYRKDGARYALGWNASAARIRIHRLDGEERSEEEGNVAERFPVRIYSQKQLFELARNPNALLRVVDDSPDVRGAELQRQRNEAEATYLSCLATARSQRAQAADLAARRAALADVRRKIALLEQGAHAATLNRYRSRVQANERWTHELGDAELRLAEIEAITANFPQFSGEQSLEEDTGSASLGRLFDARQRVLGDFASSIAQAIAAARQGLIGIAEHADLADWNQQLRDSETEYQGVVAELSQAGIANPQEYGDLVAWATTLEQEIGTMESHLEASDSSVANAREQLRAYRTARSSLSERRSQFANTTSNELVRMQVVANGERGGLEDFLRDALGIDRFEDDYEALAARINPPEGEGWSFERLDTVVETLRNVANDPQAQLDVRDRRFATAVRRLSPERIDRVALYLPEDKVQVSFRDPRIAGAGWTSLALGSPGQQTAALLAFVLGYGTEPMILDQPEDDLDSTLIYELVVKRLRETKQKRQIIVVTHNPNIVVHGDAELVVSLSVKSGQTAIECSGGLQELKVRGEVCRVLEGGPDAFRARFRRIMHAS